MWSTVVLGDARDVVVLAGALMSELLLLSLGTLEMSELLAVVVLMSLEMNELLLLS